MKFVENVAANQRSLVAYLGTVELSVMGYHNATNDGDVIGSDEAKISNLTDITAEANTDADAPLTNPVTFSGDFSFAKKVVLSKDMCATISGDTTMTLMGEDDESVKMVDATVFDTMTDIDTTTEVDESVDYALCIEVDGMASIPKTEPYQVSAMYEGSGSTSAFNPIGMAHDLAMIDRDGTQFNIPFLTDDMRFKQRISIQNRGRATTWSLSNLDTVADSVMTAPGMGSGDLPMGQTVINMWEHIDVMGGSRASGSISIPLSPSSITASVDIVNPESGAIDTTILTANQ